MSGVLQVLKGSKFNKKRYLDSLKMMYDLFNKIRRDGPNSVENDIEAPDKSKFFGSLSRLRQRSREPGFRLRHHAHGADGRRGGLSTSTR